MLVDAIWMERRHIAISEIWAKGSVEIRGAQVQRLTDRLGGFDRYRVSVGRNGEA